MGCFFTYLALVSTRFFSFQCTSFAFRWVNLLLFYSLWYCKWNCFLHFTFQIVYCQCIEVQLIFIYWSCVVQSCIVQPSPNQLNNLYLFNWGCFVLFCFLVNSLEFYIYKILSYMNRIILVYFFLFQSGYFVFLFLACFPQARTSCICSMEMVRVDILSFSWA